MATKYGIALQIIYMHSMTPGTQKFIFPVMAQIGLSKGFLQFQKRNITWINFTFIKALQMQLPEIKDYAIR